MQNKADTSSSQGLIDRAGPGVAGPPAVSARQLTKDYGQGSNAVNALRGIDVNFERGRFTAIMGPSGSGKSTLMHVLAGLDTVTSGHVYMAADLLHPKSGDRHHPSIDQAGRVDLTRMDDRQLTLIRRRHLGFIFQSFNLLPMFTAKQNILMPLVLDDVRPDTSWMEQLVETLGLSDRLDHRPSELSGGQQQRVAIARALITKPSIVFADEPTGNLDTASSTEVLGFLRDSVRELGQTVIMVTHDAYAASYAHRALVLADGRIVADRQNPTVKAMNDLLAEQVSAGTAGDSQVQD